jgi:hypothetical protein
MNVVLKRSSSSKPRIRLITRSPYLDKEMWSCRHNGVVGFGLTPDSAFLDYRAMETLKFKKTP